MGVSIKEIAKKAGVSAGTVYIRDNWLNDLIFKSYNHIVEHCCYAWRKIMSMPEVIQSIAMRD